MSQFANVPFLGLRTIVAEQSETCVYQVATASMLEAFPNLLDDRAADASHAREGIVHSVWPRIARCMRALGGDYIDGCGAARPPAKLAVKVLTRHHVSSAASYQALVHEVNVMAEAWEGGGDAGRRCGRFTLQPHLSIPIAVIVFKMAQDSDSSLPPFRCAVVSSYIKACPLQRLAYAFPEGIVTMAKDTAAEGGEAISPLCTAAPMLGGRAKGGQPPKAPPVMVPTINFCRDVLFQLVHILRALNARPLPRQEGGRGGERGTGITFRDLKLPNVLVDCYGKVTLIDFGHALSADGGGDGGDERSLCGPATRHTSAPELFPTTGGARNCADYRYADLWSFGVFVFEWVFGRRIDCCGLPSQQEVGGHGGATSDLGLWWQVPGNLGPGGLDERYYTAAGGGGRRWHSGSSRIAAQLGHARHLIDTLLVVCPMERARRIVQLRDGPTEGICAAHCSVGELWGYVAAHPLFAGACLWDPVEGFLASCDGDVEEEVDMQTLGM